MKPLGSVKINYVKNTLNSFPMSKFSLYHPTFLMKFSFLDTVIYVYTVTIKKTLGMSHTTSSLPLCIIS